MKEEFEEFRDPNTTAPRRDYLAKLIWMALELSKLPEFSNGS